MRRSTPVAFLALLLPLAAGCATFDEGRVTLEVRDATERFEELQRRQDAAGLVEFLAPEFTMLQDGVRVGREETARQIEATLPSLRRMEPSFEDIRVTPVASDAAIASFLFRDEMETADGTVMHSSGSTTLLWRRVDGNWRIAFADADHDEE